MRISKLKIQNFRSIQLIEESIPQICALIGPNNAGKSNVLRAIQKVMEKDWLTVSSFTEEDVFAKDAERDVKITLDLDPAYPYVKFKGSDPVEIASLSFEYTRYKVGSQAGQRRLEQKCFDADGQTPSVLAKAPKRGESHKYETLYKTPPEIRENVPLIYIGANRSLKEQLPNARYSILRQLFEGVDKNLHDPSNKISVKRLDGSHIDVTRIERYEQLIKEAMKTLRTDEFVEIETSIKSNALKLLGFDPVDDIDKLNLSFSPFDTFEFYKSLDLQITEGEFSISATEVGDGLQNALILAILQTFEAHRKKGAIFLIEEPEMFLHPQMQRSLYKTLGEIGKTNQVIYTTHSPHFVTVPEYDQVMLVRKEGSGTVIRKSNLENNDTRRQKLIKEFDPERNELFFAERLLLVEGDTEKMAFPEYAKRLGIDIDRIGSTIVEVGGKRNLIEFATIATSFGIPTGIVYDEDSSDFNNRGDEEKYNSSIDLLETNFPSTKVWRLTKDYEEVLRNTIGESDYQSICQKFPKTGKPTRARLIAMEESFPIPDIFSAVLNWLGGTTAKVVGEDSNDEQSRNV